MTFPQPMTPQEAADRKDVSRDSIYKAYNRNVLNAASTDPLRIADDDALDAWTPKRHKDRTHKSMRLPVSAIEAIRSHGGGHLARGLRSLISEHAGRTDLPRPDQTEAGTQRTSFRLTDEEIRRLDAIGGGNRTRGIERLAAQV